MTGRLPIVGDPASVSRAGSVTANGGARLAQAAADLATKASYGEGGWVGPTARATHRRLTDLGQVTQALAAELTAAGSALQGHATTLAIVLADLRALVARADSAGLRIEDGQVVPRPGLRGEADATGEGELRRTQQALAAELTSVLRDFRTTRTQLRTGLGRSRERLTDMSGDARRGPGTR